LIEITSSHWTIDCFGEVVFSPKGIAFTIVMVAPLARALMKRGLLYAGATLGVLSWIAIEALAQRQRLQAPEDDEAPIAARNAEFHFLRVQYTDLPQYHRRWGYASRDGEGTGWWLVDWPAADNHFTWEFSG
jgi:hypothetical protein